ncbi:hypothetical protein [Humibacillus xanthopallidus]|uniref:hypothetical protein n=1 Tax=Humibacillus xanthopallidus TaxID=412689 RepID=UPI00384F8650
MVGAGSGALRLLRALAFVATTVLLTVTGHAWAGGSVSPAAMAVLAAVSWPVALMGSARERRIRHLFPALAVGQLVGHGVLTFFTGAPTTALACAGNSSHRVHALTSGCLQADALTSASTALSGSASPSDVAGMAGMAAPAPGWSAAVMALAHLAAALLLAALLARGEALLWRVLGVILRRAPRLAPVRPSPLLGVHRGARITPRHLVLVVPGRGPPTVTA